MPRVSEFLDLIFSILHHCIILQYAHCSTAIDMPERAVAVSPNGYLLACVYSRDDSDMREEPEMYVWDLRPLVADLLWNSRKHFVMFLVGCKYIRLRSSYGTVSVCDGMSGLTVYASSTDSQICGGGNQSEDVTLKGDSVVAELKVGAVCTAADYVFSNLELMKYLVQFI